MRKAVVTFAVVLCLSLLMGLQVTPAGAGPAKPPAEKGGGVNFGASLESNTCYIWCNNGNDYVIDGDIDFFGCWDACEFLCGGPCYPV